MKNQFAKRLAALLLATFSATAFGEEPAAAPLGATSPRLYALDCGAIRVGDMAGFSDIGDLDGQKKDFVVPCFVIVHPKGILVWDAGLNDGLAAEKNGVDHGVFHLTVKTTLATSPGRRGDRRTSKSRPDAFFTASITWCTE